MQADVIDALMSDIPDVKEIVNLNLSLMDSITALRKELAGQKAINLPEVKAYLSCMYQTIRIGVKILGDPAKKMVLLQMENGAGDSREIFLNTKKDWEKFLQRVRAETEFARAVIDEAAEGVDGGRRKSMMVERRDIRSIRFEIREKHKSTTFKPSPDKPNTDLRYLKRLVGELSGFERSLKRFV